MSRLNAGGFSFPLRYNQTANFQLETEIVGTLFIVPTPIGNLEDITLRALRVLREVALIAAEDTRTTRNLLNHFQITTPLTSYHEHNKLTKLETIFNALENGDVALVSDAGTPGISDPGFELIQEAILRGIRIEPLPGANAAITALVASGLPTDNFMFVGFLPKKAKARADALHALKPQTCTLIAYESPNRLIDLLEAIIEVLGDRPVCVAREITKIHEEFFRGSASDALTHYREHSPRGEVVVIIGGAAPEMTPVWDETQVRSRLLERLAAGDSLKDAAKAISGESGWDRRRVYQLGLDAKNSP